MRTLAAAFAATALALWAAPASARDRALVVGIDRFPQIATVTPDGRRQPIDLSGAVVDAQTFAKVLAEVLRFDPADIKVLTDAEATRERILAEAESWLIAGTRPGERALLFYAGHGAKIAVTDPDGSTRFTSALVPADARGDLHTSGDKPSAIDGLILGTEIARLIERLPGRQVTLVADSCHSGSISRSAAGAATSGGRVRTLTPRVPLQMRAAQVTDELARRNKTGSRAILVEATDLRRDNLAVWSAATVAQVTFDHPERPGGVFTQSFIDGLRGKADRLGTGEVTAASLLNYVQDEAKRLCAKLGSDCRDGLTPDLISPEPYRAAPLAPSRDRPAAAAPAAIAVQSLTHTNDFPITAEILPGPALKLGQEVAFRIRSAEAGRLVVLDAGLDGKLTPIFPNRFSEKTAKDGRVRANAAIAIPDASYGFAFTAGERGPGTLIAIVAEEGADLSAVIAQAGAADFAPLAYAKRAIEVVAAELQAPVITPDPAKPNRARRWGFVAVPYRVE